MTVEMRSQAVLCESEASMHPFLIKKLWLAVVLIEFTLTMSCSMPWQSSNTNTVTAENEAIAESIFRYQIERRRLKARQLYFLSLGDSKDPSDDFMRRFEGFTYSVKRYSESTYQHGFVTEKTTGELGIRLEVKSIKWVSRRKTEVEGSWFAGYEDYLEQRFYVYKENGKWSVMREEGVLIP